MNFISTRIITADVQRLVNFYERVTGSPAIKYTEDFAELQTNVATLAIGSTRTLQLFGNVEMTYATQSRPAIIEFKVNDVDADYSRLADFLQPLVVQKPTTMPWGNRSLLFRDPDGNLVNFFTPVTPEAIRKFEQHR